MSSHKSCAIIYVFSSILYQNIVDPFLEEFCRMRILRSCVKALCIYAVVAQKTVVLTPMGALLLVNIRT